MRRGGGGDSLKRSPLFMGVWLDRKGVREKGKEGDERGDYPTWFCFRIFFYRSLFLSSLTFVLFSPFFVTVNVIASDRCRLGGVLV